MQNFFTPKTIAVIGASNHPSKVGYVIFNNLYKKFKVFPVNNHEDKILGEKVFKSVSEIPSTIDLAVISVPSPFVIEVIRECGKKGIKSIILITSGFKEVGNEKLELELFKVLEEYNIKCVGPNCLGVYDTHSELDSLFLPPSKLSRPKAGGISFVSQSGALGSAILDLLSSQDYGIAKFISYGNGTNLSETDYLEYLGKDKQTKVICMYVEGIKDGKRFMSVAKKINKPIIAIKGGISTRGAKAVMSHTGSLAGSFEIYKAAFKQSKVILADSVEEMFEIAKLFDKLSPPKGKKIQVITNGGGYGILTTDALEANKLTMSELSSSSKEFLKKNLPAMATVSNPIDLLGDATNSLYDITLKIVCNDNNIDIILLILLQQTPAIDENIVQVISKYSKVKPLIVISTGGNKTLAISHELEKNNIPVFQFPDKAVNALRKYLGFF